MKRFLALVLAVVMVMSLACVASAADVKTYKVGCHLHLR